MRRVHRSKKDEIVMMAQLAESLPNIEFRGLMGYDGHAQGNTDVRVQQTQDSSDRLAAAKGWVEAAGLKVPLLSGAGSGNYWEAIKGSTNEIQAGGGVLFCMNYADSHNVEGQAGKFQHALKMQIQIISIAGMTSTHHATLPLLSRRTSLCYSEWRAGIIVRRRRRGARDWRRRF
jgi:D-serine deaminase-like pyridoxal phosphate-dependent protein|eukprot:COSAG02_NODE_12025_length_1610_cov_3.595670_2_plen_175_part_00